MDHAQLTRYFTLAELTRSAIALRHGVCNSPGPEEIARLALLARHILEPVRRQFNIPFRPSSGYRSPEVNRLVGSRPTSRHLTGQAVDFEVPTIANRDLAEWIKANLSFDQLILEFHHPDDPASGWVHCSYHEGNNRNERLIFDGASYREF